MYVASSYNKTTTHFMTNLSFPTHQAASDDDFRGHESAACPVITSEPQKTVKILTAAGWTFFEAWKCASLPQIPATHRES